MDQPGNHILLRGNQPAAADRMRELLARTVQNQFADQRSNAGAIDDIRQRMEGLEWLVKETRPDPGRGPAATARAADPRAAGGQQGGRPPRHQRGQQGEQQGGQPHLTPQGVGLGGYRERYVPGVLGAGVRGKAGRG